MSQSILVPENNGKQNLDESHIDKQQNHVGFRVDYKLECVDDNFSKSFKSYLGQDDVNELIINVIKKSKYCSKVIKKHFNKELVIIKENDENFESSAKYQICENTFVVGDIKKRGHCYITGKYRCLNQSKPQNSHHFPQSKKIVMYILLCENLENSISQFHNKCHTTRIKKIYELQS